MSIHGVNERDVEIVDSGRGTTSKYLYNDYPVGDASEPAIMIRIFGPDTDLHVHSHPFNEMFYVLEGELEIGDTTYSAGSCIYIQKNTPYGPTRAPKSAKVLRYAESQQA
jgi:quercetin dioxygenase-like cupin family protein